jgi:lysyl-tRNA synthetase class 2
MVTATRDFFLSRGYIETDTPALAPSLIPESCLEAFATEYVNPFQSSFPLYLVPSPEVWMKRIIAETHSSVFQICKSFRNAESMGRIHNPEFTMLEYYTVGASSKESIALTQELFRSLAFESTPERAKPPFIRITMAEAFHEFAGLELSALRDTGSMIDAGRSKGLVIPNDTSWEDAFNIVFLSLVETRLPSDRPLVLDEYPKEIECLARDIPGTNYKERWELYVDGMEVANCYTETGDRDTVRRYFASQAEKKKKALVPHMVDFSYPDLFSGFPPCSGVAIGFDRLLLAMTGRNDIADAIIFPFKDYPGMSK